MDELKNVYSLSEDEARHRFTLLDNPKLNLNYNVELKLSDEQYQGIVEITFEVSNLEQNFFIEFFGEKISKLVVNDQNSDIIIENKIFITISKSMIKKGLNSIVFNFESIYNFDSDSHTGIRAHTTDDGCFYIHTKGEPYGMNKVFPCLDQPDLKATFDLALIIPKDWNAVGNENIIKQINCEDSETHNQEKNKNYKLIQFKKTPKISTYLFAFVAGNFCRYEPNKYFSDIPMSLYCSKQAAERMDIVSEQIFEITSKLLNISEEIYDYKYPYSKYDQIFLPYFPYGGMENVGAVTITEGLLYETDRGSKKTDICNQLARLISHELTHMWFGNTVTMKWWDDLWLNEGFTDFMCSYILVPIQNELSFKIDNPWIDFMNRKNIAYSIDRNAKLARPICCRVENAKAAATMFDGVTYMKGAAIMKQLYSLMGKDNFLSGIRVYIKTFAEKNATTSQFFEIMNNFYKSPLANSPENLMIWKKDWVETAGLNYCLTEWEVIPLEMDYKLNIKINLRPFLKELPLLRHHKIKIGIFNEACEMIEVIDAIIENVETTYIEKTLTQNPVSIFVNYDDDAYITSILDNRSQEFFKNNLTKMSDGLNKSYLRSMLNFMDTSKFDF